LCSFAISSCNVQLVYTKVTIKTCYNRKNKLINNLGC